MMLARAHEDSPMNARLGLAMLASSLALAAGCKGSATQPAATQADPTAGRARIAVIYSGNMWAELLDCG